MLLMKKCFIVCPIGDDGSETRKRSDTLLNYVLKPVCSECDFEAVRVDELNTGNSISNNIINHLKNDDLVIADLTDHNPNAFYELGYRMSLGKPVILIKAKGEVLPFDVTTIQTFDYNLSDIPDTENFKTRIKQTIHSYIFDEPQSQTHTNDFSQNFNQIILQQLYAIQDMIKNLSDKLSTTDTTAISVLADKLSQANAKTPEAVVIETLLPALLKDPESFIRLAEFSQKFKK